MPIRADFALCASLIKPHAKILDVGCDTGDLLTYLRSEKNCDTRGIEKSSHGVKMSVKAGHSVIQGDANIDLQHYPTDSFDVAILSKTIQAMQAPRETIKEITRIGKKAIVGFSNFGHYSVLWDLLYNKRMPTTKALPLKWYSTPNIHFCTIRDFVDLCESLNLKVEQRYILNANGKIINTCPRSYRAGLFGVEAVFLISQKK